MAWRKGQSGNPNGRPKLAKFKQALEIALNDGDGKALRRIAQNLVKAAEEGEMWAIKEVADRLDGKPAQQIDMGIENTRPLSELSTAELGAMIEENHQLTCQMSKDVRQALEGAGADEVKILKALASCGLLQEKTDNQPVS